MADRLDIVVFGATGFTGKFTLPQVHKLGTTDGRALTWGVAGRSEAKLKDILAETAKRIGVDDLNSIPIIIADTNDEESIKRMTARARGIINCCGPYQLYGEVVVKARIETGTHHVDVSGESLFIEYVEEKYHEAAKAKGVYIVSACGFDSIPADLGVVFLQKNFEGTLNSVELYLSRHEEEDGSSSGSAINYGTWESAIRFIGNFRQLLTLRKLRNLKPLPKMRPKLSLRFPLRRSNIKGQDNTKWILPLFNTDRDVVLRSQRYFCEHETKRPVQMYTYLLVNSFTTVLKFMFFGLFFVFLCQLKAGRDLLLKYPKFFSAGYVSHEQPPEDRLDKFKFSFTLYGEGWDEKLASATDQYNTPPNKQIVGRISGSNPGYGFTCVALTLSAIMILTETKKLPSTGGVYTTAAAFAKTSIFEQFQKKMGLFMRFLVTVLTQNDNGKTS